jgi:DegV family protein with EDD domain
MTSEQPASRAFSVVTDSTGDIPSDIALERGIVVVPLSVHIAGETFVDGELTQERFFERMDAAERLPTTSQPPVGAFVEAYERALSTADEVISVHISNRLSGTVESARQAAEGFSGKVHVFDSLNLSWGLAMQVVDAAASAAEGRSVDEALESLASARRRVKMIVGLDKLDNLAKGGRIGHVSAFLGSFLNVKVTLTVDETGVFQPVARNRGENAALEHTLDWVAKRMGGAKRAKFAVGYMLAQDRAEQLRDRLLERYEAAEMVVYPTGSVIATHTGTGWGVTVLPVE